MDAGDVRNLQNAFQALYSDVRVCPTFPVLLVKWAILNGSETAAHWPCALNQWDQEQPVLKILPLTDCK